MILYFYRSWRLRIRLHLSQQWERKKSDHLYCSERGAPVSTTKTYNAKLTPYALPRAVPLVYHEHVQGQAATADEAGVP